MDSSVINKEIKTRIRPLLQSAGFSQFTTRNAWRYCDRKIDVTNFQSFNSYLAGSLGCTTYSFGLNLGCSFNFIPQGQRVKRKDGYLRPEEYECHFRLQLRKAIEQPNLKRADVWYVDPAGENVRTVIDDAKRAILETGLDWFSRFNESQEVLRTLLEDLETNEGTHGFGANPCPARHFMTGFAAITMGDPRLASGHLQKTLSSGCFREFEHEINCALKKIEVKPD